MSYAPQKRLECNSCGKPCEHPAFSTAPEARTYARLQGWKRSSATGYDYCPECWPSVPSQRWYA